MHDELVNALRRLSDWSIMDFEDNLSYANQIAEEAADAIEELQKAVMRLEEENGILDELPMVDQSTPCETCVHKGNVDFDYCHICNNEADMYKPKPPKWIPVTERLPKEEKCEYWCYTDVGVMCECRWTNNRYGFGASDKWGWNIMDVPQYQKVTHWMPLPEPPKEGT